METGTSEMQAHAAHHGNGHGPHGSGQPAAGEGVLMPRLRESTAEAHKQAEELPFAKAMLAGTLPLDTYKAYLGQRALFHAALDDAWHALLGARPDLARVLRPEHLQFQYLRADAAFLGIGLEALAPSAGTAAALRLVQDAVRDEPLKLIGHLYVHEGSKNGGMFLSRAVRRMYQFEAPNGTRYLEPYGNEQRATWAGFKLAMEHYPWTEAERDAIVAGALEGFLAVQLIDEALPLN